MALKDIEGYEGLYAVSDDGKIWSYKRNKFLVLGDNGRGYKFFGAHKNSKVKKIYVHRVVASAFLDNPEQLPQVNHKDGDKENNCVDNLEWVTLSQNMRHAWSNGLCKPEPNQKEAAKATAKLRRIFSDEQVKSIRNKFSLGAVKAHLAKEFNVSSRVITQIVERQTYKEVF